MPLSQVPQSPQITLVGPILILLVAIVMVYFAIKKGWYPRQFRLSSVLLVVAILAVSFAWWRDRQRLHIPPTRHTELFDHWNHHYLLKRVYGKRDGLNLSISHERVRFATLGLDLGAYNAKAYFIECRQLASARAGEVPFAQHDVDRMTKALREKILRQLESEGATYISEREKSGRFWETSYETDTLKGRILLRWTVDTDGRLLLDLVFQERNQI